MKASHFWGPTPTDDSTSNMPLLVSGVLLAALAQASGGPRVEQPIQVRHELRAIRAVTTGGISVGPRWDFQVPPLAKGFPDADDQLVQWIKEQSGLTWDQLARAFGVSRRAVHMWASGSRINSVNAELLREFAKQVLAVSRSNPDETRALLLAGAPDARSIFDEFRAKRSARSEHVSGTPFSPRELLG